MTIQVCSYCTREVRRIADGRAEYSTESGACMACLVAVMRELVVIERDPETNFARPVAGGWPPTAAGASTSGPAVPFSIGRVAA